MISIREQKDREEKSSLEPLSFCAEAGKQKTACLLGALTSSGFPLKTPVSSQSLLSPAPFWILQYFQR